MAQPVLNSFRLGADTLVAYRAGRIDVILFVLGVVLLVPLALYLVELLAGLVGPRWQQRVHAAAVACLLFALVTRTTKSETDLGWKRVAAVAIVIGVVGAVAVWRWHAARLFLCFLSVASLWFAGAFLFSSPVTPLVVNSDRLSPAHVEVGAPAPVVWVVFDELPTVSLLDADDVIDAERYPNFASLARDATWYRNNTTVATNTPQAVPALLTGIRPRNETDLPIAVEHPHSVFTLLGRQYELHVSEGWTRVCPRNLCSGTGPARGIAWPRLLREGGRVWEEQVSPKHPDPTLRDRWETRAHRDRQVDDFVAGLGSSANGRPRLDLLHVVLPHVPFDHLPDGRRYEAPGVPAGAIFDSWFDQDVADAARERHLLQVAYADRVLGEVLRRLRELHRYDRSLIVVTADHGAAFQAGNPMRHTTEGNTSEILWAPLLVKSPGQHDGSVDDTPTNSIDVLPTVADLLDVELPWPVDGRAAGAPSDGEGEVRFLQSIGGKLPADHQVAVIPRAEGFRRMLDAPPAAPWHDPLGLYRHGRYADLVGRRVDVLRQGRPVTVRGHIDQAGALADVDPAAPEIPAYLSGDLTTTGPDPVLAIAVNGVIGGWGRGYLGTFLVPGLEPGYRDQPRPRRWWTVVPPDLLRRGANRVDLFEIRDGGDGLVLRPVRLRT